MQVETLSIKRLALWCEWEESTSHRGQSLHNGVRIEQGNFNYSMDDVTGVWGNCCQSKQLGSSVCLWRHSTPHDPGWSLLATLVVFEGLFSPTVTIHINIMCMNDWNVRVVQGAVFSQTSYHTYQRWRKWKSVKHLHEFEWVEQIIHVHLFKRLLFSVGNCTT